MGILAARLLGGLNRYLSGSEKRGRKFDRRRKANLQLVTRDLISEQRQREDQGTPEYAQATKRTPP
jgi:hypothetical protein